MLQSCHTRFPALLHQLHLQHPTAGPSSSLSKPALQLCALLSRSDHAAPGASSSLKNGHHKAAAAAHPAAPALLHQLQGEAERLRRCVAFTAEQLWMRLQDLDAELVQQVSRSPGRSASQLAPQLRQWERMADQIGEQVTSLHLIQQQHKHKVVMSWRQGLQGT